MKIITILSCGAFAVTCSHSPIIAILHQFVGIAFGSTIVSTEQLESCSCQQLVTQKS